MKDGFCSKCDSNEVFVDNGLTVTTHRLGKVEFTYYMCLTCGYSESYLSEKDRNKAHHVLIEQANLQKRKRKVDDER